MLPETKNISYDEFLRMDKDSEDYLEYICGKVYCQASPSTAHQRVSVNLTTELNIFFKNKECEVFHAPFDIILKDEEKQSTNKVIPDITVICDKRGLNDNNYMGIPSLIIEILSPSNQSHDLITKMNLYQEFKVKEYWIVNPKLNSIQIYSLTDVGFYEQVGVYKNNETLDSKIFEDLKIELEKFFSL